MLPQVPDDQLLAELAVVVSLGWSLPSSPGRASDVRHLLLLADAESTLPYGQRAQRLLTMIDHALVAGADETTDHDPVISADDATGLRILCGTLPTYRNEASPTVRRQEAAIGFLIPGWRTRPPRDPAGTFLRRHQHRALRQALYCLRAAYGQATQRGIRDYDVLARHRWFDVGANRQIVRMRGKDVARFREDGLEEFVFTESERDDEGLIAAELIITESSIDGMVVERIEPIDTQPGMRAIRFRMPRAFSAGDELTVAWQEELAFGPDAPAWHRYFAAAETPNDGAEVDVSVTFLGDDLPETVWWFSALPDVDVFEMGPAASERLLLDAAQTAAHRWTEHETERRISYGLQWNWA